MKPYLCGPINGCTDEEANNWRDTLMEVYPDSINPMVRDYRGKEGDCYREIVDLDKRDVRECDIVIVNYSKPSVGTSMEMMYAWTMGKPIIVWCPEGVKISPWLRYHSTSMVHTLEEVIEKVQVYGM